MKNNSKFSRKLCCNQKGHFEAEQVIASQHGSPTRASQVVLLRNERVHIISKHFLSKTQKMLFLMLGNFETFHVSLSFDNILVKFLYKLKLFYITNMISIPCKYVSNISSFFPSLQNASQAIKQDGSNSNLTKCSERGHPTELIARLK